jgi:hypothetical protein
MSDHAIEIATLAVSVLTLLSVVLDRSDRMRYRDFLVRIHEDAATEQEREAARGSRSSVYTVPVSENDRDLAFRALAEGILDFSEGRWECRPVRFARPDDGEQPTPPAA